MHPALLLPTVGRWFHRRGLPPVGLVFTAVNRLLFGAWVPASADIGRGTKLAYLGSGVVIHARARIGARCVISPGVVIGGRAGHWEVPVIEDDVTLWPGCKVLGPVRVGRGAHIGPNAVVIHDVPEGGRVVAPLGRLLDPPRTPSGAAGPLPD